MVSENWQLETPIDAVIFDCDGTLTQIEGIDELAAMNGVGAQVAELTEYAMNQGALSEELYAQRLAMTRPTAMQIAQLGELYFEQRVHGVEQVFAILRSLRKDIYILSAGLMPAVAHFVNYFSVEPEQCIAVDIHFDEYGNYESFDHGCPLVDNTGKYKVIERLRSVHPRIVHIGDGMNDYSAHDLVTRFVGFGGVFHRESLKDKCEFYLEYPSLLGVLPLVLTADERAQLSPELIAYYEQGIAMYHSQLEGEV